MERKKISFLIIILFCFFCSVGKVQAEIDSTYYPVYGTEGDCIANGTCIRVCGYPDITNSKTTAAIYYYKSGEWQVVWEKAGATYSSIPSSALVAFTEQNGRDSVFIDSETRRNLVENWECPFGYFDDWLPCIGVACGNSFCFDSDKSYCENASQWGETFKNENLRLAYYSYKGELLKAYESFKESISKRTEDIERDIDVIEEAISDYKNGSVEKIDLPTACSLRANQLYFYTVDTYIHLEYSELSDKFSIVPESLSKYLIAKDDDIISATELINNFSELEESLKNSCLKGYRIKVDEGTVSQNQYNSYETIANENQSDSESFREEISKKVEIFDLDIEYNFDTATGCKGYLGTETIEILQKAFDIIKYLAIIILLVLSIIDFLKAIVSQDKDLLQKAIQVVVKRAIISVIIFFLPVLIEVFLDLLGFTGENYNCGIK